MNRYWDLWENLDTKKIHIVDYKSTHTDKFDKLKSFDAPYLIGYKRQAEIYSWILSKLGLEIDNTSYFFYVNAKPDQEIFNNSLEFEWAIIPYTTQDYNWVEDTIVEIKNFYNDARTKGFKSYSPNNENLLDFAKKMINLSSRGLRNRNIKLSGKTEDYFLEPLEKIINSGITPADNWKKLYLNQWSNNIDMLYKNNYFK